MCGKRVGSSYIMHTAYGVKQNSDYRRSLEDINKHCLKEFRAHWQCLENNNQQMWNCRKVERPLNKCVFDNLVRTLLQYSKRTVINKYIET